MENKVLLGAYRKLVNLAEAEINEKFGTGDKFLLRSCLNYILTEDSFNESVDDEKVRSALSLYSQRYCSNPNN